MYLSEVGNYKFEKFAYADVGKEINISLSYARKGEILGFNDLVYQNKFFCSAICISKKASFFAINYNIFKNMCSHYPKVIENIKKMEIDKRILMVQRLESIKYSYKNSLSGEFRKIEEQTVFWENNVTIEKEIPKYSKIKANQTLFKSLNFESDKNNIVKLNESDFISKNKTKYKIKIINEKLPPIKAINLNNNVKYRKRNFNQLFLTLTNDKKLNNQKLNNSSKVIDKKSNDEELMKNKPDLSLKELRKNVLRKNKRDFISKTLLGESLYDTKDEDFYFFNPEDGDKLIKNKLKQNQRKTKPISFYIKLKNIEKQNLLTELSNFKKHKQTISSLSSKPNFSISNNY